MVNLVIVSHSWHLAEGIKELAAQMTTLGGTAGRSSDQDDGPDADRVQIASVGGIWQGEEGWRLGTDTTRILDAIHEVWTQDGVIVLVDLGSAVLSTEMALELLPDHMRTACRISNAPLVEGAVMAALEASLGNDLHTVNRAAENAGSIQKVEQSF